MSKVCRIVTSVDLNKTKYDELNEQAVLLGKIRKEIWQRFGSLNGVGVNHRKIRDDWVKNRSFLPLPAKAWKETLRDVLDDISMYEEAAKAKVRQDIFNKTKDQSEQKRLFRLLNNDQWVKDRYLSRKMRQYKKHGRTEVENQIVLECGVYSQFKDKDGNTWLKIPSFIRGKQVCVPLNSNITLTGCLRVILKDGIVEVHHVIARKKYKKCGEEIIGVDKGYSEAFADSDGHFHGTNLGQVLTKATEQRNKTGISRNKLYQIAKKKPHKAKKIYRYNLGKKKLKTRSDYTQKLVRNIAFQSAHSIVDKAKEVRAEDLTAPMTTKAKSPKWKKYHRLMSSWAKGSLAEALESVTKARGSCLRLVNCAYTSQMDSKTHRLEGRRVGDKFYHVNGEVSQADTNAAVNIKHRGDDTEITRYTPYRVVKKILLDRLTAIGGVSETVKKTCNRPSRTPVAHKKLASTESELPINLDGSRFV